MPLSLFIHFSRVMPRHTALSCLVISLYLFFTPAFAAEKIVGTTCKSDQNATDWDTIARCNSGTMVRAPYWFGASSDNCNSAHAGQMQWTGTSLQLCDGTNWNNLVLESGTGPTAFGFTAQTGAALSSTITSNTVTLSGTFTNKTATCGTGCTAIAKNGTWGGTTVSGFSAGDTIAIQQTSSASVNTATTASVTVGTTTSGTWSVTTLSDPCAGSPSVGNVCADGTLYAGLSPDGNVKMYTTPCDLGMSGTKESCTGTRGTYTWNDGSTNWVNTGYRSLTTGKANTAGLVALGTTSPAPYLAARACTALTTGGHSDWYLPALSELNVLYMNQTALGGTFLTDGSWYWSSSEYTSTDANVERFSDGYPVNGNKTDSLVVRCVRR